MILGVNSFTFGGLMRMGDIIACANVVEHIRQSTNTRLVQFNIDSAIQPVAYIKEFAEWMINNTDYFCKTPAEDTLPWARVNLWDYRDLSGDLVVIKNPNAKQKKVILNPLVDATYNTYRNWPENVYNKIIKEIEHTYSNYDLVAIGQKRIKIDRWRCSTNLTQSLMEIMTAEVYIGGDTGLSHFVGALDQGPEPFYYTSSRGLLHTTPINWYTNKKGTMRTYWLDFENTKW